MTTITLALLPIDHFSGPGTAVGPVCLSVYVSGQ